MFIAVMNKEQIEEHFKKSLKEKGWNIDHPDVKHKFKRKVDEIMKDKKQKEQENRATSNIFHQMVCKMNQENQRR